jgi:hypothetical protein
MKKLLLCLVALFAAIGAQASTQTITKGEGTSGTSTVKFSATGKPDITAKAVYTLTLNADNKLKVELTFADLKNSDVEGLVNEFCYMFIDGIGETSLSYADGKYTGTTSGTATPGNFYSNCYFKLACANTGTNYGENGQLIFPFEFTAPSAAAESEISGVVSDITATTATLTLTCKPAEGKTVDKIVVSGLGVGKDITFTSTDNLTANLKDLTPGTKYDLTFTLTCTDNSTTTSTVSFTTLSDSSSDKEVKMEFIEVNVSDLSALFKLKVDLSDNNQSKEYIHMYLRKANETPKATADDPYAKYGEDKGTPAVDMREGIENPIYFNYTELEKNTKYVATAVVKKDGYTGIATTEFETLGEANGTTSYIENGYFRDGKATTSDDGQELKMTYLATARYTFTYDKDNETLYLTFDTRIRNNPDLPDMQAKYILNVGDQTYYGAPLTNAAGFKDHYSFIINYRCPDIAKHIANGDKMTFTYYTDYAEGGQSFFGGVQYDGTTSSVDFGEPADVQWIAYSYKDQQEQNKNRYDLYKLLPKTQLMATVVDAEGHYLPRKIVKFEMATNDSGKATVTCDTSLGLPKWFVEATSLADATDKEVDFEVVAYHERETEATGAPRRAVNADKNRLEAKRGFHYVESETPTGIDDIEADDANAPVRYFDLNGREISEPQKGMFVIRLQGSKATKMIAE